MNDQMIQHITRYCTFVCNRADLSVPVLVITDLHQPTREELAASVADFTAWHALNIFPRLNGFRGYDAITFEFEE